MAKTVFILGAGASVETGAPVGTTFVDSMRGLLNYVSAQDKIDISIFLKARKLLQRTFVKSSIDLDNVESVMGAIEFASFVGRLGDLPQRELEDLVASLPRAVSTVIRHAVKYRVGLEAGILPEPYWAEFAALLAWLHSHPVYGPVAVITFNYDLNLEVALQYVGCGYFYSGGEAGGDDAVSVSKLHGSVNWHRVRDGRLRVSPVLGSEVARGDEVNAAMEETSRLSSYDFVDAGVQRYNRPFRAAIPTLGYLDGVAPFIVPPVVNKGVMHKDLKAMWVSAAACLRKAESVVCIGYSAPDSDQFFRYLYGIGTLSDAIIDRFVVVDPKPSPSIKQILGGAIVARGVYVPMTGVASEKIGDLSFLFGGDEARASCKHYAARVLKSCLVMPKGVVTDPLFLHVD